MFPVMVSIIVILGAIIIISSQFWQRDPVFFYEPVFLPLYVLKGDVLVTDDGQQIVFQENMKILAINSTVNGTIIKSEQIKWFW